MDFLKNNKRISFKYDGVDFFELNPEVKVTENGNELITEYTLADGLKVTNTARKINTITPQIGNNFVHTTLHKFNN